MKQKNKNEPMRRDFFQGAIRAADEGGAAEDFRRVMLSLSSEEPCQRWFGAEILCHDPDAVDLSRLQELGVVLFNHDRNTVIGRVDSVELDEQEHKLRAEVVFDDDEESERVYQKVKSGTLKGVSVGYAVDVWEEVEAGDMSSNGRFEGPCSVATRWTPYELSIVSVPADPTVGVGRSYDEKGGENDMENKQKKPTQDMPPTADNSRAEGIEQERQRCRDINMICRQFDMDPTPYIDGGQTIEQTRAAVLDHLAQQRQPQHVMVKVDEMDKFRAAATDGLALRAGIKIDNPADGAGDFRGKRMLRLAAECIEREKGESTRGMADEDLVREALTGTGAFPGILSNVANKSMAQAYQTAPTTYQLWTAAGSNSDFKQATRYRLGEADELVKVNESGELKEGSVAESAATTSVATYGRTFSLTRQAIINDDMGALKSMPSIYGAAARRMINKMVYKVLMDNAAIEGGPLFSKQHNNLQTAGLDVAGLGAMKAAMAKQKNIGGKEVLNIQPAFLIVPAELEVTAAQLINSVVDPSKANAAVNPFANKLTVVSEPELSDANSFYLAAAAGYAPTIEVTSLNGNMTPVMERAEQFNTLGIKWRIYLDVGVNLLDFRGIQKSTVTGK